MSHVSVDVWDPFGDPADLAENVTPAADEVPVSASPLNGASSKVKSVEIWADPGLSALAGPLGREVAIASSRMRDVEDWIAKAELAGFVPGDIEPARRRLVQLSRASRGAHWQEAEAQAAAKVAAAAAERESQRTKAAERRAAADRLQRAETAGEAEELKSAIIDGLHAGLDVRLLVAARRRLLAIEGRAAASAEPAPAPVVDRPLVRKDDLAKEVLRAMKEKDPSALRAALDAAAEAGMQLPGLQVARARLLAMEAERRPGDVAPPKPKPAVHAAPTNQSADGAVPVRQGTGVSLRALLPNGRELKVEADPASNGASVLTQILPIEDASGKAMTDLRFFIGVDRGGGRIKVRQELELDRPLGAQGVGQESVLCVRNDLPEEISPLAANGMRIPQARERAAPPGAGAGRAARTPQARTATLWRCAFKAVVEPFPTFSEVEQLLGEKRPAVVVGWNAAQDSAVRARCLQSMQAVGAFHLVVTGSSEAIPVDGDAAESFLPLDADAEFGSEETERLLEHIRSSAGVSPPFLLAVVSRGYLSRRLAFCSRLFLPEDVAFFPAPPFDPQVACKEERKLFEDRILDEARRLHLLGAELKPESAQALDKLAPQWRKMGGSSPRQQPTA